MRHDNAPRKEKRGTRQTLPSILETAANDASLWQRRNIYSRPAINRAATCESLGIRMRMADAIARAINSLPVVRARGDRYHAMNVTSADRRLRFWLVIIVIVHFAVALWHGARLTRPRTANPPANQLCRARDFPAPAGRSRATLFALSTPRRLDDRGLNARLVAVRLLEPLRARFAGQRRARSRARLAFHVRRFCRPGRDHRNDRHRARHRRDPQVARRLQLPGDPTMNVFVAGASGAIGQPLITELIRRGHSVTGMTRSDARAKKLRARRRGRTNQRVRRARRRTGPPRVASRSRHRRTHGLAENSRRNGRGRRRRPKAPARRRRQLARPPAPAASAATCSRAARSSSTLAAHSPTSTTDSLPTPARAGNRPRHRHYAELESRVLDSAPLEGVSLRYGFYYGPKTWYFDGAAADQVRARANPDHRPRAGSLVLRPHRRCCRGHRCRPHRAAGHLQPR